MDIADHLDKRQKSERQNWNGQKPGIKNALVVIYDWAK